MNGSTAALLQILGYFLLLIGLLAGGLLLARKGLYWRLQKDNPERKLHIDEMRPLGNRQFLVVAAYEGKKVLLGVCPGRIDYLCQLSVSEEGDFAPLLSQKGE